MPLGFGELVTQPQHLVHVGRAAHPLGVTLERRGQRHGAGLIPAIVAVPGRAYTMFDEVVTRGLGIGPTLQRRVSIVRVNRLQPAETRAVELRHPGVIGPSRTGHGAVANFGATEDELRYRRGQRAVACLIGAQAIFGQLALSAVPDNADEALAGRQQGQHHPRAPEMRSVPADLPALDQHAPLLPRLVHLQLEQACLLILGGHGQAEIAADHVGWR